MKKILFPLLAGLCMFTACMKDFDEQNTDPYAFKPEYKKADLANIGGYITQMEKSIYFNANNADWDFQIAQNLCADVWSGFMAPPTPFAGGQHNGNYAIQFGWTNFAFGMYNTGIMAPWKKVQEQTVNAEDGAEFPEVYALSLILKVIGMQRSTDCYGPIPYSHFGEGGTSVEYDSQSSIYHQFFKELDEAEKLINGFLSSDRKDANVMKKWDLIFKGDYKKWLKVINSQRLRLAIRISKVEPGLARTEAEKAMSSPAGVITTKSENMTLPTETMKHPLCILAYAYNDIRMSGDMQSILEGLKDPRLPIYFNPAGDIKGAPEYKGKYLGIRQGIDYPSKGQRENFSNLGNAWTMDNMNRTPIVLLGSSEVYFLRAEGALRGWSMGGTPEELYKKGIEESLSYWGLSGADYINDGVSKPIAYVDPTAHKYDMEPASTVTVKWDEGASKEEKLEKIITQKWIALFPEGQEAWSEFRRTGYPRLFPMTVNLSQEISSTIMIRRMRFETNESERNKAGYEKGVQALIQESKGAFKTKGDNEGTQLWWDTNAGAAAGASNF